VVEAEIHYRRAIELLSGLPQTAERDCLELTLQMALGTKLMGLLFGFFISATGSGRYGYATNLAEKIVEVGKKSKSPASLSIAHTFLLNRPSHR
jgi:hypothetical protein